MGRKGLLRSLKTKPLPIVTVKQALERFRGLLLLIQTYILPDGLSLGIVQQSDKRAVLTILCDARHRAFNFKAPMPDYSCN